MTARFTVLNSSHTISRQNLTAIAQAHAALAADRTLGGMIEDLQEQDIAPVEGQGKDIHGSSPQYQVTFYTPRDDWFTIVGAGGATF